MPTRLKSISKRKSKLSELAGVIPYQGELAKNMTFTGPATDPQLDWERRYQPNGVPAAYVDPNGGQFPAGLPPMSWGDAGIPVGASAGGLDAGLVTKTRAQAAKDKKRPR